jgi:nitroreductase
VEPEKIRRLQQAALLAPSSRGICPWEFVFVQDRALLAKLSRAKSSGSSFLEEAPLGIVVCADPAKSDAWVEDTSIASAYLLLAAEAMGLGACWIQIRKRSRSDDQTSESYVMETLGIPRILSVESIIAAGYPAERPKPRSLEELVYGKISFERYGEKR